MRFLEFSRLDPFEALLRLQEELDRVFERPLAWWDLGPSGRGVFPPANIFSDREGYVIRLEVPGLRPEDITVEAHGNTLTVSGKRDTGAVARGSFHRRERWSGEFSRSFQLPPDLDPSKAQATYSKGILTIRVPKREEAKPRAIPVQAS